MRRRILVLVVLAVWASACSGPTDSTAPDPTVPRAPSHLSRCHERTGRDAQLVIPSPVYATTETVRVHLTPCPGHGRLAVLYLLHGAGADQTQWVDLDVGQAADELVRQGVLPPTAIIMPNAATDYGSDPGGARLATLLIDEIEPVVAASNPLDGTRRAIGGISRGAALAFLAFDARSDAFVALGGHSPATEIDDDRAQRIADAGIPIWLDAGTDDSTRQNLQTMATTLEQHGVDVEVHVSPGKHDRSYWRSRTPDYLRFYAAALR